MLNNITIGQYIPGNSIMHKADPRTKIIVIFAAMIVVFMVQSLISMAFYALVMTLLIKTAGIPFIYILKSLKPILILIIFTALINLFITPGKTLVDFKIFDITYEGLDLAVKMAMRLILLIITATLLTLTTTPISLTDGLEKLFNPLKKIKVPVHEMAMMMSIALRFIPTLIEETDKIMKAQASRGADFDTGNIYQKAKSFIPVLVPLFVSSFKRADELALAMESRCYRGSENRTKMKILKFTKSDIILVLLAIILFTVIIVINKVL